MYVYHYGDKFDLPFVNTRCLLNNVPVPSPKSAVDTCKVARKWTKFTSNRLGTLADALTTRRKGQLSKRQWKLAALGHRPTMDKMVKYCVGDTHAVEAVYKELRKVMRQHPNMAPVFAGETGSLRCPACGSASTRSHGRSRSMHFLNYHRRCNECSTTYISKKEKIR
jgi:hypothetical protein